MSENITLTEWIKAAHKELLEVNNKIDRLNMKIDSTNELLGKTREDFIKEVSTNREEFVVFKTRINVRTATISGIIGTIAIISSILFSWTNISHKLLQNDGIPTNNVSGYEQPLERNI